VDSPKSHAARTVALPPFLSDELAAYMASRSRERDPLLFPDASDGLIHGTNWKRRTFDTAAEHAKLTPPSLRIHDLRHMAASLAIRSGANVKTVQHQLGHRSATLTLDHYGHLFPDELDALSDALQSLRSGSPADSVRTLSGDAEVVPISQGH
jgi:integrase